MTNGKFPFLQELARDLGRPAPALYLAIASYSIAKAVCLTLPRLVTRDHSTTNAVEVPAQRELTVPSAVSDATDASCLPMAASVSAAVTGQQEAEACSRQLTSLLQDSPTHVGLQLLQQHQHRRKHQQHLQHSYFDDPKRLLLFGCSVFALYAAQPSRQAWLALMQSAVPDKLPTAEEPRDMLMARTSAGQPMQPKWVPRRFSIQRM